MPDASGNGSQRRNSRTTSLAPPPLLKEVLAPKLDERILEIPKIRVCPEKLELGTFHVDLADTLFLRPPNLCNENFQMKKIFRVFVLLNFLGLFANSCPADIIASFDFDGGNDVGNAFPFSGGNDGSAVIGVDQNFMGSSRPEVAQFDVTSISGNPLFAGGGLGVFDLSADPSFVAGNITVADIDRLNISFDLEVVGPSPTLFRLERPSFFQTALDLNITPIVGSGFQNVSVDLATLDLSERNALVNELNGAESTQIQLIFQFDVADPAITEANIVRFDNLTITAVPEPSGIWILAVCGLAYFGRRRR